MRRREFVKMGLGFRIEVYMGIMEPKPETLKLGGVAGDSIGFVCETPWSLC